MYFAANERRPNWAKDPAVVHFNGRYFLYYSIAPGEDHPGLGIGIAESNDLVNWRYIKEAGLRSAAHPKGYGAPGALIKDGKVYLFYQSYGNRAQDAICLAVSSNGIDFTVTSENPIFHPPVSSWSCGRAIDADIIFFKGKYFLYAATRDPLFKIQKLTVAVSEGDFSAAGWKSVCDGTILEPELPWEQQCIEAPATLVHNDKIYLFYAGAYNNCPQQIGCAVSSDGIKFERISKDPILPAGRPGEWNSSESGHPYAFTDDDGSQYLFYQGNNDNGQSWYLSVKKILWEGDMPVLAEM